MKFQLLFLKKKKREEEGQEDSEKALQQQTLACQGKLGEALVKVPRISTTVHTLQSLQSCLIRPQGL